MYLLKCILTELKSKFICKLVKKQKIFHNVDFITTFAAFIYTLKCYKERQRD
jgi:hypothetical protein